MKPNFFWFLKLAVWLVIGLIALLLFIYPLVTGWLINAGRLPLAATKYFAYVETAQISLMRLLGLVWIFFLGSCFASFLNVVAWRIPRGRGINGSSKCPYCNVKLSFFDNIPIAGWLRNRGRCRTCRLPISPRYLIVEFILGFVFLFFCVAQLLSGGMNLPLRTVERLRGFEHLIFDPKWDLIQLTLYHLVLICLLFTFALIRSEKLKIPISIFVTGIVFGIGLPLIWPSMQLISWQIGVNQLVEMNRFSLNQLLTMGFGLAGGFLCGFLVQWSCRVEPDDQAITPEKQRLVTQTSFVYDGVAGLALAGLFLGWQSGLSITILFFVVSIFVPLLGLRLTSVNLNLSSRILIVTLVHLLCWRALTWLYVWPGPNTHWGFILGAVIVLVGLAITTRLRGEDKTPVAGTNENDSMAFEHDDNPRV